MQHFYFELEVCDGDFEYAVNLLGIAYSNESSFDVADAIASQFLQKSSDWRGYYCWEADDRTVEVKRVDDIDLETHTVLKRFLPTPELDFPHSLKAGDKVFIFQKNEDANGNIYRVYARETESFPALAAYFKALEREDEDGDPSLPDFKIESWIDADFSE